MIVPPCAFGARGVDDELDAVGPRGLGAVRSDARVARRIRGTGTQRDALNTNRASPRCTLVDVTAFQRLPASVLE